MHFQAVFRILGMLLMLFSASMLTPIIVSFIYHEPFYIPFIVTFLCTVSSGAALWLFCRNTKQELKIREGFLIVALFWLVLCSFGALPFIFLLHHHNHWITDALFESVSGLTTTGASIINHLSNVPHALLFYRQQLQFLGGMGIVVLAVAVLPMLRIGGMQLYRAETPGPMKESKLTPRIAQSAKMLWSIYLGLTIACILSYKLFGMNWFEAICESFATVSTGGFSLYQNGFDHYNSTPLEMIASIFMLLSAINFGLYFVVIQKRTLRQFWKDEECRLYLTSIFIAIVCVSVGLFYYQTFSSLKKDIPNAIFTVISFASTTGFTSGRLDTWPTFIPFLCMLLALVGGCAASTSGGVKMIRGILMFKQAQREMHRLLHPHAIFPIKFGEKVLAEPLLQSMWAFISAFIALYLMLILLLMAFNHDFVTAFSAINATLTNAGAGLGSVSQNFAHLNMGSKWLLIFSMLAGRLEIFSLLILFSRQFWQN